MVSRRKLEKRIQQGFREITIFLKDPYSEAAEDALFRIIRRYEQMAAAFLDGLAISKFPWAAWVRVLEIRFIQLISADQPAIETAVRGQIARARNTSARDVMREIFRVCMMNLLELGKENKRRASNDQLPLPKRVDLYWKEALEEVADRMRAYAKLGHRESDYGWGPLGGFPILTIKEAPTEWYTVFGKVLHA